MYDRQYDLHDDGTAAIVPQGFLAAIERDSYANRIVQLPVNPLHIDSFPLLGSLFWLCHSESQSADGAGALPFASPLPEVNSSSVTVAKSPVLSTTALDGVVKDD